MKYFWVLSLIACFGFSNTFAEERDPWAASDERFKSDGLCYSFPDGSAAKIAHTSWSRFGRDEWDYEVRIACKTDASGQQVASITNLQNGRVFSTSTLKEADWLSYRGNMIRQKALATQSFGMKFTLESVREESAGQLRFDYTVRSATGVLVEEGYWILGEGPVLQMIVERYSKKFSVIVEETRNLLLP